MFNRASLILGSIVLAQLVLLGSALTILLLQFRSAERRFSEAGQREQALLNELADSERDLYNASILLRDTLILDGEKQDLADRELRKALVALEGRSLLANSGDTAWMSPEMKSKLAAIEEVRRAYLERAKVVTGWEGAERQRMGVPYLAGQVSPLRFKFTQASRETVALTRAVSGQQRESLVSYMAEIRRSAVQILGGAALLGLAVAVAGIWQFRRYERERELHIANLKQAETSLRTLSQRLVESQEQERKRLSRELHDEVGQIMTALRVQLGQVEPSEDSRENWRRSMELAERSLRSIRELSRGLRPAMLDDLGLPPALKWLGREFSKTTGLPIEMDLHGEFARLNEASRTCVYRVVQEALTNCIKHAAAQSIRVTAEEHPNWIVVTVQDDGRGMSRERTDGIGLLGMKERLEELGGELEVQSAPGAGTRIRASLPQSANGEAH